MARGIKWNGIGDPVVRFFITYVNTVPELQVFYNSLCNVESYQKCRNASILY